MLLRRKHFLLIGMFAGVIGGAIWTLHSQAAPPDATVNDSRVANNKDDDDDEKKPLLAEFMRHKLDHTNDIMEGLLVENPKMIVKAAERLKQMSDAEEWRISNDMMYRNHSEDFRRAVDKLIIAAKGKSIDRAALASFDVTLSCIDCHRYVRTVLIAETD